jgi:hypothetical protein
VREVKRKIVAITKEGNPDNIRLIYGESILDDAKTLNDYKIDNDHAVFWVRRREGNASPPEKETHTIGTANLLSKFSFFFFSTCV